MIGRTISHYEIIEQIGEGGMGTVYKALDTKLKVHRALKFIHPHLVTDSDFKHRFIQEAQAASSLDHPNICGIHQVDETVNGRPFIVMTYYEGVTLSEKMKEAPLSAVEIFRTGIAIAQGLKCAHDHGIIHRDIKPSNILITDDGYVKILDFGLAKLAGIAGVTKTGVTMGTVRYMAPEQGVGKGADHRSDLWSLGLIMYELATGEFPFEGEFDPAVIYSILNTEPVPAHQVNPEIPESHSRVISHCLDKDAGERYQSAAELINDMVGAAQSEGWGSSFGDLVLRVPNSGFGSVPAEGPSWRKRLAVVAMVVAAIAAVFWWSTRPQSIYSTELRVAVMPLKNRAHPSQDFLTLGMWEVVGNLLDQASRLHESMWVVPTRLVKYAEIGEDAQARETFGVNRIITGSLQRFEGGQVLLLELRDAQTLDQVRTVRVPFDSQSSVFSDSLPGALLELIDLEIDSRSVFPAQIPETGLAARDYLEGLGLLMEGNFPGAIEALEKTTVASSVFGMGWSALGWAQWNEYGETGDEGQLAAALQSMEKARAESPGMWWPRFHAGEILRKTGNDLGALVLFQEANGLDPGNPLVCRGMARIFRADGRLAEADAILRTALQRRPDYFEAPRILAVHYYWAKVEQEETLRLLERVLELAPFDSFALNTLGALRIQRGEYKEARVLFERAYALTPKCETCSNVGLVLFFEGKFEEAASFYELALEYCGEDDLMIWANWAKALYWSEGGREKSIPKFERAIEMTWDAWVENPGDPELIGDLIDFHAMIGDEETTLRLIAEADSLTEGNGELMYTIGCSYEMIGDREAALRYLADSARYGIPVERFYESRDLQELVTDPRFVRMITAVSGQVIAPADTGQ